MTGTTILIMLAVLLPVIFITAITPIITRRTEAFGVTIPEEVKSGAFVASHIKRYIGICILLGVILLVSLYVVLNGQSNENVITWSYTGGILLYMLVTFIAYYTSHTAIKSWKQQQPWYHEQIAVQRIVVQTSFQPKRYVISPLWYIPHLLLIAFTTAYSLIRYDDFPDVLPMKYDFSGQVTSSVEKSLQSVLMLSFIGLAIVITFLISHYAIVKSKQIVESHDPQGSLERNRIFRFTWSIYTGIAGFIVVLIMCMGQLTPLQLWTPNSFMLVTAVGIGFVVIGATILSIKLGQGGSRIVLRDPKQEASINNADLDKYWKAGIFYWNPQDPAIFVEKRFGVGWSMNFANPLSWIIFIGILLIVLVPTFLLDM